MGVRKLNKFLTTREITKSYRNIQEFINKLRIEKNNSHNGKIVIAIDFWLYAHKFLHSNRSENILLGFWNQVLKFFLCGIVPLYVMDGSVPIEKQEKVDERTKKRNNCKKKIDDIDNEIEKYININDLVDKQSDDRQTDDRHSDDRQTDDRQSDDRQSDDRQPLWSDGKQSDGRQPVWSDGRQPLWLDHSDCCTDSNDSNDATNHTDDDNLDAMYKKKEKLQKQIKRIKTSELYNIHKLLDVLGVPYVKAEFEADAMCAKLFKEKIITTCLSDDMDMLALGCGSTIKFHDGKLIEFNMDQIKENLEFNQEQFIDMCIMFGCDYLQHPFRFECEDVYKMIKKHGSLLDALCSNEHELFNMNNSNVKVIGEQYYQVKETYLSSYEREHIPKNLLDIKMQQINFDDLLYFLKKLKWFDVSPKNIKIIEESIEKINTMIEHDEL